MSEELEVVQAAKPARTAPNGGLGRPKGTRNKLTTQVRSAIEGALNAGDGAEEFFIKLKEEDPRTFCNAVVKLLPVQVEADLRGQVDNNITVTFVGSNHG